MEMPVQWSDLPDDLLCLVYSKVAGPLNRVRFAAVCRLWRATAVTSRHAAPPVLPWLIFRDARDDENKTKVYCPEDGHVFRMSLPSQADGKRLVGAHDGGWIAVLGADMRLIIVNIFSGVEVPLPANNMCMIVQSRWRDNKKIVFSASPTSSGCILATITPRWGVAFCGIACPNNKWTETGLGLKVVDIVFCNGQLYGLTIFEELVKFQIGVDKDGNHVVIGEPHRLSVRTTDYSIMYLKNIIDLHGKLAMVVTIWPPSREAVDWPFFKVFELLVDESTNDYTHEWKEVTTLDDCALFLGETWSKVVYMSAVRRGRLQRNCIYSIHDPVFSTGLEDHGDDYLYSSSDDAMSKIRSYVVARAPGGMWVLPPDF